MERQYFLLSFFFFCFFPKNASSLETDGGLSHRLFSVPVREHSVIVTPEGFYPRRISLFAGDKLKLFITSTLKTPSCFMIEGKELFLSAVKGKISEGEVLFNTPGVYSYYCPTGKITGRLTVLEKRRKMAAGVRRFKQGRGRGIASVSEDDKAWRPREWPKNYNVERE